MAAVVGGIIRELFSVEEWLEATRKNFPDREPTPNRYGFKGEKAPEKLRALYVGKRAPERKKGEANPVRYVGF